eukprot:949615_1
MSITITCGGSDCHFDEDTVDVINNILIAYLDEEVQITGTTIVNNKVIIAIANADWNSLDRDTVSKDIKNELKYVYDEEVNVTFDDTEDDEDNKQNSNILSDIIEFLSSVLPFSSHIILGIMIGLTLFFI